MPRPTPTRHPKAPDRWDPRLAAHMLLRASSRERGTILLMVVGVLALLAIIGVVYATLGKSDRSTGRTNQQKTRAAEQVEDVGNYIAKVIAEGALATYPEAQGNPAAEDASGNPWPWVERQKGFTFPLTSRHYLSVKPSDYAGALPNGEQKYQYARFSPSGNWVSDNVLANRWAAGFFGVQDFRRYGDPYLSTLEPEYLNITGERLINGNLLSLANRHDWRAISDFAPSGNFVNLANLRPGNGGINAEPGFGIDPLSNKPRMSYGLTLYDLASGLPIPHTQAQTWYDTVIPAGGGNVTWAATNANPLIPAHWTMNQAWAFRPAIADDRDAQGNTILPSSYEYAFNQWADADGDGFFDSRWFEIADVGELFTNQGPTSTKVYLSGRGRTRVFIAARCIDACSMVNVNVANDGWFPPQPITPGSPANNPLASRDQALPLGIHPGEVNLRRILTHSDIAAFMSTPMANGGAGLPPAGSPYAILSRPATLSASEPDQAAADYSTASGGDPYGNAAAFAVGRDAFSKIVDSRGRGVTETGPHDSTRFLPRPVQQRLTDFFALSSPAKRVVGFGTGVNARNFSSTPTFFDIADEIELRTFFGVNDSDSLSRLEAAMGAGSTARPRYQFYSPLRDNRPRMLEMKGRDEFGPTDLFTGYNPGTDDGRRQTLVSIFSDVRHLLTTVSAARPSKDASIAPDTYSLLTWGNFPNLNGRPIGGAAASTDVSGALRVIAEYSNADRSRTFNDMSTGYIEYQLAVAQIFRLYLNALAPYTVEAGASSVDPCFPLVWTDPNNRNPASPNDYQLGLVYGGVPELAVRMAAHMTANLIDAFDRDRNLDTATGRPIVEGGFENRGIDRSEQMVLDVALSQAANTMPNQLQKSFLDTQAFPTKNSLGGTPPQQPAFSNDRRLCPDIQSLPSARANNNQHAGEVKVFGVEAQPFITEVSSYFIYCGDPTQSTSGGPGGGSGGGRAPPTITVKTTPDLVQNTDFIGEILAFQLNNPFDQDVVLYDPRCGDPDTWAAGRLGASDLQRIDRYRYYLEYAGHYYVFARQKTDSLNFADDDEAKNEPVVLHAGETRVFYVTNPGSLSAMALRATSHVSVGGTISAQMIEQWLTGRWLGGKPEASAAGNGQLFLRDAFNVSPGTALQDVRDGDPSRPHPIMQVQDNIRFQPTIEGTSNRVDFWGIDVNGNPTIPHSGADNAPQRRIVQLWRFRRSDSTTPTAAFTPPTAGDAIGPSTTLQDVNDPTNDILADRLRDHAGDLDDHIPDANTYATSAMSATTRGSLYEPRAALAGNGDITYHPGGAIPPTLTIVAHGRITRPTDTQYDPASNPTNKIARGTMRMDTAPTSGTAYKRLGRLRGVLPPWCIEARSDDDTTWGTTRTNQQVFSLNKGESVPSPFMGVVSTPVLGENTRPPLLTLSDITDDTASNFTPTATLPDSHSVYLAATYDPGMAAAQPRSLYPSLNELFAYPVPINPEIAKPCEQKLGNEIHVNRNDKDYRDVAVEFYQVGEDRLGGAGNEYQQVTHYVLDMSSGVPTATLVTKQVPIRRSRNPMLFSRAGDFLLPLAVGPWFDPSQQFALQRVGFNWFQGDDGLRDREVQWMTLAESLALATGYYGPVNSSSPYYRFAWNQGNNPTDHKPLVDRGHLVLDRFSPYLRSPTLGMGTTTYPLGSGAPFALSILDQFRVAPGIASTPLGAQRLPEFMARNNTFNAVGSPDQSYSRIPSGVPDYDSSVIAIPGKINLNTATLFTASTIPMINPGLNPKLARPFTAGQVSAESPNAGLEDNWLFAPNAMDMFGSPVAPQVANTPTIIDVTSNFYDGLRDVLIGYRNNAMKLPTAATLVSRGDQNATNNPDMRLAPGFKGIGELGALTMRHVNGLYAGEHMLNHSIFQWALAEPAAPAAQGLGIPGPNPAGGTTPQYFAPRESFHGENISAGFYDRRADGRPQDGTPVAGPVAGQSQPGQDWYARKTYDTSGTAQTYPPSGAAQLNPIQRVSPSEADRSYQAKLAILNSAAASASVRSDVFVVYFLVHAYTPEDVEIPDDQPLVPSVAKRFVMVVDRSEVRGQTDKPKILMLKEVPLN